MNQTIVSQQMEDGMPMPRRIGAIIAIAFSLGMSVLDGNIINVALPTLSQQFAVSPSMITWLVNGYQLAIVVTMLSFSAIGEIVGYRKVYLVGIVLFGLTSLACAFSISFPTLMLSRVLQGICASALASVNTAQLRNIYPKQMIGRGMAINAMVVAVSSAAGPSIAGAILAVTTWHWLFAINVPLSLIALAFALVFLPRNELTDRERKFDWLSALENAVTFGLLIYTVESFAHSEWWGYIVMQCVIVLVVGYFYVRRQLGQAVPLLPLDLLRIPIFRLSVLASICSFTAQMLAMVALPFLLQNNIGRSVVMTGVLLTAWPIASLVSAPIAGRLVEKVHPGKLGCVGMLLFACGLLSLAFLTPQSGTTDIILRMSLCGFGFGLFQTPNNATMQSSAPLRRSGGANGMQGMARIFGQTFGTSLVALSFSAFSHLEGAVICFPVACVLAVTASVISVLRVKTKTSLYR